MSFPRLAVVRRRWVPGGNQTHRESVGLSKNPRRSDERKRPGRAERYHGNRITRRHRGATPPRGRSTRRGLARASEGCRGMSRRGCPRRRRAYAAWMANRETAWDPEHIGCRIVDDARGREEARVPRLARILLPRRERNQLPARSAKGQRSIGKAVVALGEDRARRGACVDPDRTPGRLIPSRRPRIDERQEEDGDEEKDEPGRSRCLMEWGYRIDECRAPAENTFRDLAPSSSG